MRPFGQSRRSLWLRRTRVAPLALVAVSAMLLLPFGALGVAAASAAPRAAASTFTCSGADTQAGAGTLTGGTYSSVTVNGGCLVDDGQVTVTGNLTVETSQGALIVAFAKNDHAASGTSGLTVDGNILVDSGATLILGCEPNTGLTCIDDSSEASPDNVHGSVVATNPLGVVVHDSTIGGDARQSGGGGGAFSGPGADCTPTGVFNAFGPHGSPAYSDYEDNTIGGNLWVTGLQTCWFGALRDKVGGSVSVINNTMADPDAGEVLTNHIQGNLVCAGNSPANQYGDSGGKPNIVGGFAVGQCGFGVLKPNPAPVPPPNGNPAGPLEHLSLPSPALQGYDLSAGDGGVFTFGTSFFGSASTTPPNLNYVGIATAPGGLGYWLANASAAVKAYGPNAQTPGSWTPSFTPTKPVVGIAAVPGGDGYWEAAADGGVFSSGPSATFYGSAGGLKLVKPIVGIAAVPTGNGYDLVAADGGVFTYGKGAVFHGSTGGKTLVAPIVGMANDPTTGGYWLVASDGGVFSFDAPFYGSLGGHHLDAPIAGIAAAPTGNGYYLVAEDGGVFALGPGTHFQGSLGNHHLVVPIDGIGLG